MQDGKEDQMHPVFIDEDMKWYFWNEDHTDRYGPYNERIDACIALMQHCCEMFQKP